jgi:hypothetical protein
MLPFMIYKQFSDPRIRFVRMTNEMINKIVTIVTILFASNTAP